LFRDPCLRLDPAPDLWLGRDLGRAVAPVFVLSSFVLVRVLELELGLNARFHACLHDRDSAVFVLVLVRVLELELGLNAPFHDPVHDRDLDLNV
jgi:hypothetical protein